MLFACLDKRKTKRYVDVLDKFIDTYNDRMNSRLKFTPNEMEKRPDIARLSAKIAAQKEFKRLPEIPVDTKVRKVLLRGKFAKGHEHKWSKTIHTITKHAYGSEFTHDRYYLDNNEKDWYRSYELQVVKNVPTEHDSTYEPPPKMPRTQKEVEKELKDLPPVQHPIRQRAPKRKIFSDVEIPKRNVIIRKS